MKKTVCDICGKDMFDDSFGLRESIDCFNFAMSRNGKYLDICQDCRDELWKWMEKRKEQTEDCSLKSTDEMKLNIKPLFCKECGITDLEPQYGQKFCRYCGTKFKNEDTERQ